MLLLLLLLLLLLPLLAIVTAVAERYCWLLPLLLCWC